MKSISLILGLCWMALSLSAQNTPVGIWKTIDDVSGEANSHLEVYEKDGKLFGKIHKLLTREPGTVCDNCPGDKKGKPLLGMEILWDLRTYKDYWSYGRILDPDNGKTYKCSIWVEDGGKSLTVRGYIGISALGRSQTWYRVEE